MNIERELIKEIIIAATEIFRQKGFYCPDISNISPQLPVDFSEHFIIKNKAYLAIEAMNYVQDIFDSEILVCAYDESMLPIDRIIVLNKNIESYFIKSNGGCIFVSFCMEGLRENEEFQRPIQRYFNSLNDAYRNILKGICEPERAQLIADEFVADLQGALIMMRVTGACWPIQRLSERFISRCKLEQGDSKQLEEL